MQGRLSTMSTVRDEDDLRIQVSTAIARLGWPVQRAADIAGMHRPHVSAWLSGRRRLKTDTMLRLTRAVGLEVRVKRAPRRLTLDE
ncbi:MAG: helix-turn-helix domain-containing protein [Planctomycetota bacterium]|nr:MAG: helix-turn-helix domain-containing protein [Planctomycetota bacterium]